MDSKTDTRRRLLGAVFLLAALGMLVAGETVLKARLSRVGFAVFWLICLTFTCLAMLVAFLDAMAIRRRTREEQREFLQKTLKEIADKEQAKWGTRSERNGRFLD